MEEITMKEKDVISLNLNDVSEVKKDTEDKITLQLFCNEFNITQFNLLNDFIIEPLKRCINKKQNDFDFEIDDSLFSFRNSGDGQLSRIIRGTHSPKLINNYFNIILAPSISQDLYSHGLYAYTDYPFLKEIEKRWRQFIQDNHVPDSKIKDFFLKIEKIIEKESYNFFTVHEVNVNLIDYVKYIYNTNNTISYKGNELIIYQLSVSTIAAFIWPIWEACIKPEKRREKYTKQLYTLIRLLFPDISPSNEIESEDELEQADRLLTEAINEINKYNYNSAGKILCKLILTYKKSLTASGSMQYALELLDECRQNDFKELPKWLNSYDEIKSFGETNITHENNIIPNLRHASSEKAGFYYIKCSNTDIYNLIIQTTPENWKELSCANSPNENNNCTLSSILNSDIIIKNSIRIIFADDNFDTNINEALNALNILKLSKYYSPKADDEHLNNIEIVIRCEQEVVTPILDTACSILYDLKNDPYKTLFDDRMGKPEHYNPIKIHILDEKKRTADLLYANYPLFYPMTTLKVREQIDKFTNHCNKHNRADFMKYNLVIVSDNKDIDYTMWLIREAFELLQHINTSVPIKSKIIILSPYANEITNKTTSVCPGLAFCSKHINGDNIKATGRQKIDIDDLAFPIIEYYKIDMNSSELNKYVEDLTTSRNISYYIVDSSSDLNAIQIGIRIRKTLIRKSITTKKLSNYSPNSTIIAIRCTNPIYSNMAHQLIVPKETERDNLWFNDYRLITFGSINDIFSWDELTGGVLEFMSFCMHRQYSTPSGKKCDFSKPAPDKTRWTYYNRMYNRDSSYSAAVSLPYRLFEANVYLESWEWSFFEKDTLWSEKNRKLLATRFYNIKASLKKNLCKWEHNRFCCYLLSRGWLPAYPDEVTYYMRNGVKRHTLQIAQLHPCLCSWDGLKNNLYETLHSAYLGPEDSFGKYYKKDATFESFSSKDMEYFQDIDNDNINQTADLLNASPYHELERDQNNDITR